MGRLRRREFLKRAGGGALAAWGARRIAAADGFELRKVVGVPALVERIEVLRRAGDVFVRAQSKDGVAGLCVTNGRDYLIPLLKDCVVPFFIGKDARDVGTLVDDVYRFDSNYKLAGLAFWNCVGWVELSLLDMLGQIAKKPVAELFGGIRRREIPVYISSTSRDTPERELERYRKRLAETGARAVKFKVGGRMSRNQDAAPGRTERIVPLLRKALGDQMVLYADANGSYDVAKGIEVGRLLEAHGVAIYEEPCPFDEYEDTKRVADALSVTVAGGEQDSSLARFRWIAANRGLDLLQPDLMYNGGFIRALRVAKLAQEAGLTGIAPHHPKTGVRQAPLLQFAACVENLHGFQEYHVATPKSEPWASPTIEVKDGKLRVPTGFGMGITVDADYLRAAERI